MIGTRCWQRWGNNPLVPEMQSAGRTQSGLYASLDAAGNRQAGNIGCSFTVRLFDHFCSDVNIS